jgi:hypothetical protein
MLLKDLGARFGSGGSTAAGAAVVRATLAQLHVKATLVDGSGLSRADHESPRQVVTLLRAMHEDTAFVAALPVAGRTGTLALRMRHSAAQDHCQAKTGTLSNVSALAGYCRGDHAGAVAAGWCGARRRGAPASDDGVALTGSAPPYPPASSASNPASSITVTPSRSAFSSFDPAASPATT